MTPVVASALPASVSMAGGLGLSTYCTLKEGGAAVNDIRAGNYFQGAFHVGTAALGAQGGYQIGRHYLGPPPLSARQIQSEISRYLAQGYSQAEAQYLAAAYPAEQMGHHFFPRDSSLPSGMKESPFNIMKPTGISRGRMYERHALADDRFSGTNLARGMQPWRFANSGLTRPNQIVRTLHGLPDITRGVGASAIVCTRPSPK